MQPHTDSNHNLKEKSGKKRREPTPAEWWGLIAEIAWGLVMTVYHIVVDFLGFIGFPRVNKSLKGLHVLVTGGARGLGREICLCLAREGCKVTAVDVEPKGCEETASLCHQEGAPVALHRVCDITDKDAVKQLIKDIPPVDVLINNAGIVSSASILEVEEKHIERMMQVNVMAHYWTIRAVLPGMIERGSGHIVAVASAAAFTAAANIVPYTATKYAVTGLMASLREEMRRSHPEIKTTSIHPFFISPPPSSVEHWDKKSRLPDVTAEEVAEMTVHGIKRERITVTVPSYLYYLLHLLMFLPNAAGELWRDIFPAKISALGTRRGKQAVH